MSKLSDAIPNRIRALRMERGWTLAELAERAQTSPSQIMKLEKATRRLDFDWVTKLAHAFEMSERELIGEQAADSAVRLVPLVGDIAAGNWQEAIQNPIEMLAVPVAHAGGPNIFALRPRGTSMNLIVPEGGYVIVDPDFDGLREGLIYAVMNNEGETTLKRFRQDPARLEPCSSDPSHKPIELGQQPFTVIGRAVAAHVAL